MASSATASTRFDRAGNIVGVVVEGLNPWAFAEDTNGHLPEGANFAIKAAVVLSFLRANGLKPLTVATEPLNPASWGRAAQIAESYTVLIEAAN
jgi:hypothetical protein